MGWGALIGVGASILGGLFGGKGDSDRADRNFEAEQRYRDELLGIARENLGWTKDRYNRYQEMFEPLFFEMREMMDDNEPDFGAIAGDVKSAFDSARGQEQREMRRYGITPTDGAARSADRQYRIREATAHIGARNQARQQAKDERYDRRSDLYRLGLGQGNQAAYMVSGAMGGVQSALSNNANAAGSNARYYDQRADENAAGWGEMLGGLPWDDIWGGISKKHGTDDWASPTPEDDFPY